MWDTIAAVSTGRAPAGIGILRLSGPEAIATVERVFTPVAGPPMGRRENRKLVYGTLRDMSGGTLDCCLCTVSRGPGSYTGEDTAELQCHGSPMVLQQGLAALFAAGARQAEPGEFTRRAFLNGRLDLTQAEAVIDLIQAETPEAARNAAGQLQGAIRRKTDRIYDALGEISSHYHAVIDYPDEDIPAFQLSAYAGTLTEAEAALSRLLSSFERGKVLTAGIPAALVGRPNAGKSALLNALLGYERAIVTEIPGTTRDTISERVRLGNILLRLTDTAGLRDTADRIEQLGVARSRAALAEAALVFVLVDSAAGFTPEDKTLLETAAASAPTLLVWSKCDLPAAPRPDLPPDLRTVALSARTGQGLDELETAVAALLPEGEPDTAPQGEILTNARHADAVGRAKRSVAAAREAMTMGVTPDAVLTETETAMAALGELTGRTVREDITSGIFARFCVGK